MPIQRLLPCLSLMALALYGCSDDESPVLFTAIQSIQSRHLISIEEHRASFPTPALGALSIGELSFEYHGGRPVKRVGGFLSTPAASGYSSIFSKNIYDTVMYNGNTVRMKSLIRDPDYPLARIMPYEREITLNNGMVVRKITADTLSNSTRADTIHYFYNAQRRIERTEQNLGKTLSVVRNYIFDDKGNLIRISGTTTLKTTGELLYTSEEEFKGYDDRANPIKGTCLWEDIFYRSVSNNNFTEYNYTLKDERTQAIRRNQKNVFTLAYDSNGNVDYSK